MHTKKGSWILIKEVEMSWEEGIQKYKEEDVNERIANTKGFIEKQAKLLLYEFLRRTLHLH